MVLTVPLTAKMTVSIPLTTMLAKQILLKRRRTPKRMKTQMRTLVVFMK